MEGPRPKSIFLPVKAFGGVLQVREQAKSFMVARGSQRGLSLSSSVCKSVATWMHETVGWAPGAD